MRIFTHNGGVLVGFQVVVAGENGGFYGLLGGVWGRYRVCVGSRSTEPAKHFEKSVPDVEKPGRPN